MGPTENFSSGGSRNTILSPQERRPPLKRSNPHHAKYFCFTRGDITRLIGERIFSTPNLARCQQRRVDDLTKHAGGFPPSFGLPADTTSWGKTTPLLSGYNPPLPTRTKRKVTISPLESAVLPSKKKKPSLPFLSNRRGGAPPPSEKRQSNNNASTNNTPQSRAFAHRKQQCTTPAPLPPRRDDLTHTERIPSPPTQTKTIYGGKRPSLSPLL